MQKRIDSYMSPFMKHLPCLTIDTETMSPSVIGMLADIDRYDHIDYGLTYLWFIEIYHDRILFKEGKKITQSYNHLESMEITQVSDLFYQIFNFPDA
jgi:hypothetical protein